MFVKIIGEDMWYKRDTYRNQMIEVLPDIIDRGGSAAYALRVGKHNDKILGKLANYNFVDGDCGSASYRHLWIRKNHCLLSVETNKEAKALLSEEY